MHGRVSPDPSVHPVVSRRWRAGIGAAVLTALYWAYLLISRQIEIPGFYRFMAEMIVGGAWLLAVAIWWFVRGRASWKDRLLLLGAFIAAGAVTILLNRAIQAFFLVFLAVPIVVTAWTAWLLFSQRFSMSVRRGGSLIVIALAWFALLPFRMDGLTGAGKYDLHWRWTQTDEARALAQHRAHVAPAPATAPASAGSHPVAAASTDWPDFRGVNHDGIVRNLKVDIDWHAHPPTKLWGQLVGPAWSSMSVVGDRLFTQEQRGDAEAVICLDTESGKEVWSRTNPARFADPMSGIGPRATPVYDQGRLYTVGGRGRVCCLDPTDGAVIWQHELFEGGRLPIWGYSSTPLLIDGKVIVCDIRKGGKGVVALDAGSGKIAWTTPAGEMGYVSPQRAEIGGREQILVYNDIGLAGLDPANGAVLWKWERKEKGPRSVQPHLVASHQVLLADGLDLGMTLLDVAPLSTGGAVQTTWNTRAIKPSSNDVVIDEGYVYGLDGANLACANLASGQRAWRAGEEGKYGRGQLVLLADQHLLLILAESGEIALAAARPDGFHEFGRVPAITGKTWNHPAVANGRIFVRNAAEIACFQLPVIK